MRCPKCGFITFDHLETCTKCGKKIAFASEQLFGTIFKASPPAFLQFKVREPGVDDEVSADQPQESEDIDVQFSLEGEEAGLDSSSAGGDIEFDFLDESSDSPASKGYEDEGGKDRELGLFGEEESAELSLDSDDVDDSGDKDGMQIDFGELDISDLAPPDEAEEQTSAELTLEDVSNVSAAKVKDSGPASRGAGSSLEDLQTDGLDLEMSSLPPTGSGTGKILRPSVKTGTALDEFDIDLGELISGQEK